jgi:hypothetical protein
VPRLSGHGIALDLPRGWDGAITRRTGAGALPVLHASSMPLPPGRADAGGGVVQHLDWGDVFVGLLEHDPSCAGTPLFSSTGPALPLSPDWFSTNALQGMQPAQSGAQQFFSSNGRAFCLFVVVGEHRRRHRLVPPVDRVLGTLAIEPAQVAR